jgi:hypothetical protein
MTTRLAIHPPVSRTAEKGKMMKKMLLRLTLLLPSLLMITACDTSLTVGRKTIGIRSGELIYTDGYLRATYTFPFEKVWSACEKTLTDLKATNIERKQKIASGNLTALIQDDKVQISVDYIEKEMTSVSVMAGPSGSTLASQLIHDRIAVALKNP